MLKGASRSRRFIRDQHQAAHLDLGHGSGGGDGVGALGRGPPIQRPPYAFGRGRPDRRHSYRKTDVDKASAGHGRVEEIPSETPENLLGEHHRKHGADHQDVPGDRRRHDQCVNGRRDKYRLGDGLAPKAGEDVLDGETDHRRPQDQGQTPPAKEVHGPRHARQQRQQDATHDQLLEQDSFRFFLPSHIPSKERRVFRPHLKSRRDSRNEQIPYDGNTRGMRSRFVKSVSQE